ncbi:MAG: long-chain fatty acid--CoA ligase [Pseudomonadota bacterium]
MQGLMQSGAINLIELLIHAARWHGQQEMVSLRVEGDLHRQTFAETYQRTAQLAGALRKLGVERGDRVATMAWNTHRHVEAWFATMGLAAVSHTLNPRLFPEQLDYIVNHAEDRVIIVDTTFVPLLQALGDKLTTVEAIIVMTDPAHMPDGLDDRFHCYETLLEGESTEFAWESVSADEASSLCYTSGTTGNPKGVLYAHQSNILHAYAATSKDAMDVGSGDVVLMVVPMFHANAWGLAFGLPMVGARMVMPGPHMDGASIARLLNDEQCTFAAAVPTVWSMLLGHLKETGSAIEHLKEVVIGGAAVPRSMVQSFDQDYGVKVLHAWGMTEMSPLGTVNRLSGYMPAPQTPDEEYDHACKQGRVPFGVDMKIVDDEGQTQPHDGQTFGRLLVRGPWTVERYYGQEESALEDGWFDTGDIATIDEWGFMQITDRAKDVIKSGGEWISSADIENAAVAHPDVEIAACIGARHPKWDERPLLLLCSVEGRTADAESVLALLAESFAKWQLPDAVIEIDTMPLTATGKIDKKPLRAEYEDYLVNSG